MSGRGICRETCSLARLHLGKKAEKGQGVKIINGQVSNNTYVACNLERESAQIPRSRAWASPTWGGKKNSKRNTKRRS